MTCKINGVIRPFVTFEDFKKVYNVFTSFPYFESWSDEEIKQEYDSFEDGFIFGFYTPSDECIAFIAFRPYKIGEHPVIFSNKAKVIYLSDIATKFEYRHNGVASALLEYAIKYMRNLGYDYIYARTNEDNSMFYSIAMKFGFEKIYDVIVEVEKKRINGEVKEDARIFMKKSL